ncbi:MAG TPA: hypothetical protein VIJ87_17750, partial [Pyrinomonadaceae bacterium]
EAPVGSVTRILHGEGAHDTNRARAFALLFICNSTFIVISFLRELLECSFTQWDTSPDAKEPKESIVQVD